MPGPSIGFGAPPAGRSPVGVLSPRATRQGVAVALPSWRQVAIAKGAAVLWADFTGAGPYTDEIAGLVLTATGSPVSETGPLGTGAKALRFPTNNDYLTSPDHALLDWTTGTVVIILRRDVDTGLAWQTVLNKDVGAMNCGWDSSNEKFHFAKDGSALLAKEAGSTPAPSGWITYGFSQNGANTGQVFRDGSDATSVVDPTNVPVATATQLVVGRGRVGAGDEHAGATVAGIAYFSTVLSAVDHLALHQAVGYANIAAVPTGTTLTVLALTSATEGRKFALGSVATSQTISAETTGRKIARGAVLTDWALTSAVTGRKIGRGSVATSWAHSPVTTGRKIGKGSVASSLAFAPVTTGRKIGRGAVLTSWVFASAVTSAAVAGIPRGTTLTSLAFTSTSTGRKIGRGSVVTSQALTSAVASHRFARGAPLTSWAFTSTSTGRKIGRGASQTSWTFSPATEGRKRGRGAVVTSQILTSAVASVVALPSDVRGTVGASAAVVGGVGASASPREAVGAGAAVVGSAGSSAGVVGGVGGSATVRDTVGSGVE